MIRTLEERQLEIKPIIKKLNELHLSPLKYESVKLLYKLLQTYIKNSERTEINIPFPEYNCTIRGILATEKEEQTWVKLETCKN
jgi:hypothetical protein